MIFSCSAFRRQVMALLKMVMQRILVLKNMILRILRHNLDDGTSWFIYHVVARLPVPAPESFEIMQEEQYPDNQEGLYTPPDDRYEPWIINWYHQFKLSWMALSHDMNLRSIPSFPMRSEEAPWRTLRSEVRGYGWWKFSSAPRAQAALGREHLPLVPG